MKRLFAVIILAVCLASLGGCKSSTKAGQTAFFEWTDSYGRTVRLEQAPQRIISLSPAITETIYLIGAEEKLVGVSDFCNYPEAACQLPKVGGMQNISMEALLATKPDVVLIGSVVSKKDVAAIEKLNIPVVTIKIEDNIERMSEMIEILGKITGQTDEANRQAAEWNKTIQELKRTAATDRANAKSLYYVVGFGDAGDFTAPKGSHINQIIELAGCRNIGESIRSWNVSREFLFQSDPDIILIRKEDYEAFCSRHPYTLLNAVKAGHVYPIESGWIDIVSPRNLNAIQEIRSISKGL